MDRVVEAEDVIAGISVQNWSDRAFDVLMGPRTDARIRVYVLWGALVGFIVHLLLWFLAWSEVNETLTSAPLLRSPLLALYTPFSVLLAYEAYQLVQAIPKSFSAAIAKQFEVVTLIVVREGLVFLAELRPEDTVALGPWIWTLLLKASAFLLLLVTTLGIAFENGRRRRSSDLPPNLVRYVATKRLLSVVVLLVFSGMAVWSLTSWVVDAVQGGGDVRPGIFFADFFTLLILVDILILLLSYRYAHEFRSLARNTGFVLATVIMRIAVDAPVVVDSILFLVSAVVGFAVVWLTNRFPTSPVSSEAISGSPRSLD